MSGPRLIIFGNLTTDNIVTAGGEILPRTYGGNCLYSALGARVWSDSVGVVSRHGEGYSEAPLQLLRSLGVDISGVRRLAIPHGRNVAFAYNADGGRTRAFPPELIARIPEAERERFVDTSLLPDANERWLRFSPDADDVPEPWWENLEGSHGAFMPVSKHLHIANAIRARRGGAAWIQVDSPWSDRQDPETDFATALFDRIDALLPSESDLTACRADAPVEDTATDLIEKGARTIVIKMGSEGCKIFQRGDPRVLRVPVVPVRVKDPTGAGDAFCGGFLAGMQMTGDLLTAARYGTVSASFAIESQGLSRLAASSRQEARQRLSALSR